MLLSGDTGFYSGAKKLSELLKEEHDLDTELIPGLSSIAYLAAKIGISWENAEIVSLHGQEENFIQTVSRNRKHSFCWAAGILEDVSGAVPGIRDERCGNLHWEEPLPIRMKRSSGEVRMS